MAVFVLDRCGKPLMPCSEKRARLLLARGRARVHRHTPFVIRLVDRCAEDCALQGISYRHCQLLQRADGYGYWLNPKPAADYSRVSSPG